MSRKYGSLTRIYQIGFAKTSTLDVLLQPDTGTTYTANRVIQLPGGDADQNIVSRTSTDTLTNKSMSGSANTFTNIPLGSAVTGVLSIGLGGTNSSTALNNNRIMISSSGKIVEQSALTASSVMVTDSNGLPTASGTSTTTLGYLDATSSVQTQLNGKISANGSVAFTANQSMGTNKLTNVADPTSSQDAATKNYVDLQIQGVKPKQAVMVATTGSNITLSGLQTIDGVSVTAGMRVLVKDQTTTSQNGIYIASASAWSRSSDFASVSPVDQINGAWMGVELGTINAGKVFIEYAVVATVGTDPILFTFFNALSGLLGGDMIALTGSTISVDLASSSGLKSTNPGNLAGQLTINPDNSTLDINGSNQLEVKAGGITDTQVGSGAGINANKIGGGAVSNTAFGYIANLTSDAQAQLNGKASTALSNLSVTSLAAGSLLVGATSSSVANLGVGSNGQVLTVVSGSPAWSSPSTSSYKVTWVTADGTSKSITHNLGTNDVIVKVYDLYDLQDIEIDTITRNSTNVVTVTASEAPNSSGWRVIIMAP